MSSITERLINARRALYNVQHIIDPQQVLLGGRRSIIMSYLTQFSRQMNPVINLLPNVVRSDNLNIARELRNIRARSISLAQALEDRAMSRSDAAQQTVDLIDQVRSIRRVIARTVIVLNNQAKLAPSMVAESAPIIKPNINPIIAADKTKYKLTLHSLEELGRQDAEEVLMLQKLLRMADGKPITPPAEPTVTNPANRLHPMDTGPSTQVEIINQRHEKYMDDNARHFHQVMQNVQDQLPKSPKFGKRGWDLVQHAPLLLIPQTFIADRTFQTAKMKFIRPFESLVQKDIPGMHRTSNTSINTPAVIVYNQQLLAIPLKVALDSAAREELLTEVVETLSASLGDLVPVEIGAIKRTLRDNSPAFQFGKGGNAGKQMQFGEGRKSSEWVKKAGRLINPNKLTKKEQQKIRDGKNAEEVRKLAKQREETKEQQKLEQRLRKREEHRIDKFESGRKIYFVNKDYPGVAWIWLLHASQYKEISRIQFYAITLPTAREMQQDTNITVKSGPELVRQKALREADNGKTTALQTARNKLTGALRERLTLWEKTAAGFRKQLTLLEKDIRHRESLLRDDERKLNNLTPDSPEYKALNAAVQNLKWDIAQLEGRAEAFQKDMKGRHTLEKHKIEAEIRTIVTQMAAERAAEKKRAAR